MLFYLNLVKIDLNILCKVEIYIFILKSHYLTRVLYNNIIY